MEINESTNNLLTKSSSTRNLDEIIDLNTSEIEDVLEKTVKCVPVEITVSAGDKPVTKAEEKTEKNIATKIVENAAKIDGLAERNTGDGRKHKSDEFQINRDDDEHLLASIEIRSDNLAPNEKRMDDSFEKLELKAKSCTDINEDGGQEKMDVSETKLQGKEENSSNETEQNELSISANLQHGYMNNIIKEKIKKIMDEEESIFYNKECVNYLCSKQSTSFYSAPNFTLNFFSVSKKKKTQFVCDECYEISIKNYEKLCGALSDHQPLLFQNFQSKEDYVEILDSSDEDDDKSEIARNKETGDFSNETISFLQENLENCFLNTLKSGSFLDQINWTDTILKNKIKNLEMDGKMLTEDLQKLQKKADRMHTDLYNSAKIQLRELQPFDLNTGRAYQTEDENMLPPVGKLTFPPIELNGSYYAAKSKTIASWQSCTFIGTVDVNSTSTQKKVLYYKVKFNKIHPIKCVPLNHMAYGDPPSVRLLIGTRVIALFDGSTLCHNKDNSNFKSAFYPGVIAEPLQAYNKNRYLVFFDDGYAQYVYHKDIRVVCKASTNVWDDVHSTSREFIKNYLIQYQKHRPMVQVKKGHSMVTESNGKWISAKVVEVDASLVLMQFDKLNRSEWIYRGSTRLAPLFKERQTKRVVQLSQLHRRNEPYIQYMQDEDSSRLNIPENSNRAVAKKSVSKPQASAPVRHLNNSTIFVEDEHDPKGKVVFYTAKKSMPPKPFIPHDCNPQCPYIISHNLKNYGALVKPMLSGWERQLFKSRLRKFVVYRAPCGRRIRTMNELHRYLVVTDNVLNVDNFDFDINVHCLAEYMIVGNIVQKHDISEKKENMIIPCINYYDNTMPNECQYSTKRIPTEGVYLNLDPEFLAGCDCEDDCSNKEKCSCWKLTLAGAKFGNIPPENFGYQYKRLPEPAPTGIYECNVNCKCSKKCLNRVVQQPLQVKLQVFKTSNRGWGLRCLNDVPKGSFICVYAGELLTDRTANEGGANAGDEYFAELDYIEVVERLKEGYESDVVEDVEESEEEYEEPALENDSDEDYHSTASISKNASINTRLRTRKRTKDGSENSKNTKHHDDDEDCERQFLNFEPNTNPDSAENPHNKIVGTRQLFGKNESCYVMDAKKVGNIGRYFNHSCSPNLFVQNVFVDTHDLRFPWVAFFALQTIRSGTELTWNYNYEMGVVPGKVLYCECGASNCRGRLL